MCYDRGVPQAQSRYCRVTPPGISQRDNWAESQIKTRAEAVATAVQIMSNSTSSTKLMIPALGGLYESLAPLAYPLIRFSAGLFLMPHGAQKLFGWFGGGGIGGTAGFFSILGLEPAVPLVLLVGLVEVVGGLAIAIGLWTRLAAALAAIDLLVAIYLVHIANGFFWDAGGYEYPLMWAILMIAIVIRGGQKLSVDSVIGKEF